MKMYQNVFIIGATGNVGKTLVLQIINNGDMNKDSHINPTRIVGLASSSHYIYSVEGIPEKICLDFSRKKVKSKKYNSLEDIFERIKLGQKLENLVFIDVTDAKDITNFHLKIIKESNFGIVTANKNPLTLSSYEIFRELTREPNRYGYRCSVMAGAEAINFLQDLKDVGDSPKVISGCFSGTLSYIISELEKERKISDIINEAKEKGYTEPHPRDDLNGVDVAKKLLILARTSGYDVNMKNIKIEPFIPSKYLSQENIGLFIESLKELDMDFNGKMNKANKKGKTLKYIAEMIRLGDRLNLSVSLQEVSRNSPFGSLRGNLNKIMVVSDTYPLEFPYSVEAPGAGLEVTAQNIRRDLLYQLKKRKSY